MIVLVGDTGSREILARLRERGWGRIFTRPNPRPMPGEPWALDNGAFAAWKNGKEMDPFKLVIKANRLAKLKPLFGVLPDVVGEGSKSLALSMHWFDRLPESIPWYLAVQNGMTVGDARSALDGGVSGIFLGGTTEFKATAEVWSDLAHERGKKFHYARVSTRVHIRRAIDCAADSCDSSQPLWSREHWRTFEKWMNDWQRQETMLEPKESAESLRDTHVPVASSNRAPSRPPTRRDEPSTSTQRSLDFGDAQRK